MSEANHKLRSSAGMTKTPEQDKGCVASQLAEEYADNYGWESIVNEFKNDSVKAYIAGYQAAQQWISVKERLPKEDVDVAIGWFQKTASNKSFWTVDAAQLTNKVFSGWRVYPEVTHWMPMPDAPKEDK